MIIDVHKHSDWHKHNQNELSTNTDKYGIGKTWLTNPVIKRYPGNPILSADDVPYRSDLVFNAGVTKYQGKYVMVFRNDYADSASKIVQGCNLGLAFSNDGINWKIEKQPLFLDSGSYPLGMAYDPRLTVLDGRCYMCFATGMNHGISGGIAVTDDFKKWEILNISVPDNRNWVLFPERVNGKMIRLERPFAMYQRPGDHFDIWISASPDGRYWGDTELLLKTESVPWANEKIGPATPPIRTPKGWLAFFHGVDVDASRQGWGWSGTWEKRYSAGLMLLDQDNPYKVIGLSRGPVLIPEEDYRYEAEGYRDYVIFPGGMILEEDNSVKIYYGAADTVEALAIADLNDLLALCEPV